MFLTFRFLIASYEFFRISHSFLRSYSVAIIQIYLYVLSVIKCWAASLRLGGCCTCACLSYYSVAASVDYLLSCCSDLWFYEFASALFSFMMEIMRRNPIFLRSFSRCATLFSEMDSIRSLKELLVTVDYFPRDDRAWCIVPSTGITDVLNCSRCGRVSVIAMAVLNYICHSKKLFVLLWYSGFYMFD